MIELDVIAPVGPRRTTTLVSRRAPLAEPAEQFRALDGVDVEVGPTRSGSFVADLRASGWEHFRPASIDVFQVNLGKLCNMTCAHCHVDSGPDRTEENMDRATVEACIAAIERSGADTVDLTGGAPELNPHFEHLVDACVAMGKRVMDRCNLTVLTVPRFAHLPRWFADRGVEVVCSLPHYRRVGTDAQRGDGTYAKSIEALRMLNDAGYGTGHPERVLTIVTNPVGAILSGNQSSQEREWKEALDRNHGIRFDRLLALNNMPMSRFLEWLISRGNLEAYMTRLVSAFNPATIGGLMCRNTVSVDWQGYIYDCDFNQQLGMNIETAGRRMHVSDFAVDDWLRHDIATHRHCYGCTAGAGSGCGGAVV